MDNVHRILTTTTGQKYRLLPCDTFSFSPTDFTSSTIHRFPLINGGSVFIQGDKIDSIESWETWFFGLLRKR